jgi:hypothetical protein
MLRPGGEHPTGDLIYTSTGRMAAQIASDSRALLGTIDPRGGSKSGQAAAFSSYVAYSGTYAVDGEEVVHHIELSVLPDWAGGDQRGLVAFEANGDLVLSTEPISIGGRIMDNRLTWRRCRA